MGFLERAARTDGNRKPRHGRTDTSTAAQRGVMVSEANSALREMLDMAVRKYHTPIDKPVGNKNFMNEDLPSHWAILDDPNLLTSQRIKGPALQKYGSVYHSECYLLDEISSQNEVVDVNTCTDLFFHSLGDSFVCWSAVQKHQRKGI